MVIGIDLGGMSAKAALLSGAKLEGKSRVVTSADVSAEKTAFALAELAVHTAEKAGKSMTCRRSASVRPVSLTAPMA